MAGVIYKITNQVNGKVYVGKTEQTIEKRWKQHLADYKRARCKDRPLYRAFIKYGPDSFSISVLEQTSKTAEQEIYWINFYDSYKNGYNATKGGDGVLRIDRKDVLEYYEKFKDTQPITTMSEVLKIDYGYLCSLIKSLANPEKYFRNTVKVSLVDLGTEFESISEAARFIINSGLSTSTVRAITTKISLACSGKRKSAYGYNWAYIEYST
jgi:hypothetical protein